MRAQPPAKKMERNFGLTTGNGYFESLINLVKKF